LYGHVPLIKIFDITDIHTDIYMCVYISDSQIVLSEGFPGDM